MWTKLTNNAWLQSWIVKWDILAMINLVVWRRTNKQSISIMFHKFNRQPLEIVVNLKMNHHIIIISSIDIRIHMMDHFGPTVQKCTSNFIIDVTLFASLSPLFSASYLHAIQHFLSICYRPLHKFLFSILVL